MKLSYSLSKNIMEVVVGGLINRFKIRRRRDVLFFEDILANYFKKCEYAGYNKEMEDIGQSWGYLIIKQLLPFFLKKIPPDIVLNKIMKLVWINLGLLDDLHFTKKDDSICLKTKNEGVTRIIGKNSGMIGFYSGIFSALFGFDVKCIKANQTKGFCNYSYKITNQAYNIEGKEKNTYNKLNYLSPIEGLTIKDALAKKMLILKEGNKIFLRGYILCPVESTIFHLIGNRGIFLEKIPEISYNYFKKIIEIDASLEKKIVFLKNLLQLTGWGLINIIIKSEYEIAMNIQNPPYGLQKEKDNWKFLIMTILGYLWTIDRRFKIRSIKDDYKELLITFSI